MKTEDSVLTESQRGFNSVSFFREIKIKLAKQMVDMTIDEQKKFLTNVREGRVKLV